MDQAQVGSEIAAGHGWSTRFHPSAGALADRQKHGRVPKTRGFPRHVQRAAAAAARRRGDPSWRATTWSSSAQRLHRAGGAVHRRAVDAVLPGVGGGGVFLLRRVFDQRLAFWSAVLTLDQRPVLAVHALGVAADAHAPALQHGALRARVRAVEAQTGGWSGAGKSSTPRPGETAPHGRPEAGARLAGGDGRVLRAAGALTHALTIWLFVGLLVFVGRVFPAARARRGGGAAAGLRCWCTRRGWCALPRVRQSRSAWRATRSSTAWAAARPADALDRMRGRHRKRRDLLFPQQAGGRHRAQISYLVSNLGGNLIAVAFFVCLLHTCSAGRRSMRCAGRC